MRYCQNCGSPLKDDEVFCTQCGTKEVGTLETEENPLDTGGSLP